MTGAVTTGLLTAANSTQRILPEADFDREIVVVATQDCFVQFGGSGTIFPIPRSVPVALTLTEGTDLTAMRDAADVTVSVCGWESRIYILGQMFKAAMEALLCGKK